MALGVQDVDTASFSWPLGFGQCQRPLDQLIRYDMEGTQARFFCLCTVLTKRMGQNYSKLIVYSHSGGNVTGMLGTLVAQ